MRVEPRRPARPQSRRPMLMERPEIFPEEIFGARARRAPLLGRPCRCRRQFRELASGSSSTMSTMSRPPRLRPARRACGGAQGARHSDRDPLPGPLHRQAALPAPFHCSGRRPVSERLAEEVISLPMHAYLDESTQDRIIEGPAPRAGRLRLSTLPIMPDRQRHHPWPRDYNRLDLGHPAAGRTPGR